MFQLSDRSLKNIEGIDPRLILLTKHTILLTKIDYGHGNTAGLRSAAVQHQLYMQGSSKADGYDIKSQHQKGLALDFFAYVDGEASWEKVYLAQIAAAFLQTANRLDVKVKWGGLFNSFFDGPHIELIK